MTVCQKFRAVLRADVGADMLVSRARCKMWSCPHCAEVNRRLWRARLWHAAGILGHEWAFVTLTAHSAAKTPHTSLKNLQTRWPDMRKRMRRRYGNFAFVRVYELHAHKEGDDAGPRFHWHMLVNFWFDDIEIRQQRDGKGVPYSAWIKAQADELGLGWYTHAENMRHVGGAGKYITKYMSKALETLPKGTRRIQTSSKFPKLPNEAKYNWYVSSGVYVETLDHVHLRGGVVRDINTGDRVTYDQFHDTYVYPAEFDHRVLDGEHN